MMKTLNMPAMMMLTMVMFASTAMAIFNDMTVWVNPSSEPAIMAIAGGSLFGVSVFVRKLGTKS